MVTALDNDPVLVRLKEALEVAYGARLERIVLFGSRARGDARPDSDYDVAIFLDPIHGRWEEFQRLGTIELDILEAMDATVTVMPYPAGTWRDVRSPLMSEIREEGVAL